MIFLMPGSLVCGHVCMYCLLYTARREREIRRGSSSLVHNALSYPSTIESCNGCVLFAALQRTSVRWRTVVLQRGGSEIGPWSARLATGRTPLVAVKHNPRRKVQSSAVFLLLLTFGQPAMRPLNQQTQHSPAMEAHREPGLQAELPILSGRCWKEETCSLRCGLNNSLTSSRARNRLLTSRSLAIWWSRKLCLFSSSIVAHQGQWRQAQDH
jgi:hypothetical protein